MQKGKGFALLAGLALVLFTAPAWAQVVDNPEGLCVLTGEASVTPGLALAPGQHGYRFDGTFESAGGPWSCPCGGAKLVSVGTLDPGTCLVNAHSGAYAIYGGSICDVGTTNDCNDTDPSTQCPTGDANLSGICAGAVCAGADDANSGYAYAIVFDDPDDAAVVTGCVENAPDGPDANGPVSFSGFFTRGCPPGRFGALFPTGRIGSADGVCPACDTAGLITCPDGSCAPAEDVCPE